MKRSRRGDGEPFGGGKNHGEKGSSRPEGLKGKVVDLDRRYGLFKIAKFAIASGSGFLLAEAILAVGMLRLYGRFSAPSNAYSSPSFLAVDIAALALGVAFSFFLNERFTVHVQSDRRGAWNSLPARLLKFEGVNAMGNLTIIIVQFILFFTLSVTPVIGNIIGAVVSYPVTYFVSMHFVWGREGNRSTPADHGVLERQGPERVDAPPPPAAAVLVLVALSRTLERGSRRIRPPRGAPVPIQ